MTVLDPYHHSNVPCGTFCQWKRLTGGVLSISENFEEMWGLKVQVTRWPNMSKNAVWELYAQEVSEGQLVTWFHVISFDISLKISSKVPCILGKKSWKGSCILPLYHDEANMCFSCSPIIPLHIWVVDFHQNWNLQKLFKDWQVKTLASQGPLACTAPIFINTCNLKWIKLHGNKITSQNYRHFPTL